MRRTIYLVAALLTILAIAAEPPAKVRTDLYGDPLPPGALVRLGTVRLRQQGRSFAFSPDGKQIASACSDGFVRIWDAVTGQQRSRLDGFHYPGRIAYSPDGKLLAVYDFEDCTVVHLWDMMTGKRVHKLSGRKLQCPTDSPAPAFSPDGKLLALGEHNTGISLWNPATGDRVRRLDKCKGEHDAIAFLADGKQLLVTNRNGVVELWDLHGRQLRKFETGYGSTCSPAIAADGKSLVLGAASEKEDAGILSVWDIATGKERRRLDVLGEVVGIALAPDGKTLAYSLGATVHLQDMESWKQVRRIDVSEGDALNLEFSPESKTLAACVEDSLQLWDTATGRPLAARPGHITAVDRVVFTANGRQLISIARNQQMGTARVWDALTGQHLHMLPDDWNWTDVGVLCASRDGNLVLLGDVNTITVWDAAKHRRIRQVPLETKRIEKLVPLILALTLSPDGRRMTSLHETGDLTNATLQVWDVASGKRLSRRTFDLHEWAEHPPIFSPDGRLLATTDGRVIWLRDAVSGTVRQTIAMKDPAAEEKLLDRLTFSNDGRLLACISSRPGDGVIEAAASTSGKVRVWEVPTGTELPPLAAPWTQAIAFAPDGRTLATAGGAVNSDLNTFEKPIRLWDIATGKEIAHFEGYGAFVGSLHIASENYPLAFSPDGQKLATGLMDSTVLLWDLKPALHRFAESRPAVRAEDLPRLWTDLAGLDARKAQASLFALARTPELALPFLEQRLKPASPADAALLHRLIADLDSEQFAVRKSASVQLRRLGRLAEPALRKALEGKPSLESRRRIEDLLAFYRGPAVSAEMRRTMRAVAVLEHLNCDRSRCLLTKLADGAAEARLTEEARAALDRLPQR